MPSPLAHIGAALALRHLARPGAWPLDRVGFAAAFASIAPDFDMLLVVVLPAGLAWHHGPTHSLVGAGLLGALVALAFRLRKASSIAVVVISGMAHVVLDGFTGDPTRAAEFGVPWAWPFAEERWIAAHTLFIPFEIDGEGFLWNMVMGVAWRAYGVEAAFVAACFGVVLVARSLVPHSNVSEPNRPDAPIR